MKKTDLLKIEKEEHSKFHRRVLYIFVIMMIMLFGGATFYFNVENWRYLDSIYFATATMTTIGYGDFTPKTDAGKIFTIFFAFTGVGIVLYGLTLMASHFVEVREEFWMEKIKGIRIRHPRTLFDKIRRLFNYKSEELISSFEKSSKRK